MVPVPVDSNQAVGEPRPRRPYAERVSPEWLSRLHDWSVTCDGVDWQKRSNPDQLPLDYPGYGFDGQTPRLSIARKHYKDQDNPDLPYLVSDFREWRDYPERMTLNWKHYPAMTPGRQARPPRMALMVSLSKRGNPYYQYRTERRLRFLNRIMGQGGRDELWTKDKDVVKAEVLEVTLTCPAADHTIRDGWQWISFEWNKWLTRFKQLYPGSEFIRAWESTEKGYPHIHSELLLPQPLTAYKHLDQVKGPDQKQTWSWRLGSEDRDTIKGSFPAHVDVKAVRTLSNLNRYLVKHVIRGTESGDQDRGDQSQALMWIYGKRSFSLSQGLLERLSDLMWRVRNSKLPTVLRGEGKGNWTRGAFVPDSVYGWSSDVWVVRVEVSPG
jgi:hypothetical protein